MRGWQSKTNWVFFFSQKEIQLFHVWQVSIIAATACRYLYWQRSSLEYLFVKETYLATVLTTLIARDITTKLYAMNKKVRILILKNMYFPGNGADHSDC